MRKFGINKKNLMSIKDVTKEDAKTIMEEINTPFGHTERGIEEMMDLINKHLHGYGVEAIPDSQERVQSKYWLSCAALYVNMGDTYAPTILYDIEKDRLLFTTWGDWYESYERRK